MESNAEGSGPGRLLVLGATGGAGRALVNRALAGGHEVRALVRSTAKLGISHPKLRVVEGSAGEPQAMNQALDAPLDAVISTLGIYHRTPETPLADIFTTVLAGLKAHGPRRLICMTSLGVGDSAGQGNWIVQLITRYSLSYVLADKGVQETMIHESGLDWTLVRPPRLTNGPARGRYTVWEGEVPDTRLRWSVSRADAADFMLALLSDAASIGRAYQFYN